jgi:hypothetical protein
MSRSSGGQLLRNLTLFGRLLRRLGLGVTLQQVLALAAALERLDLDRRADVKNAARAILVTRRDQIELFDRAFDLFFTADAFKPRRRIDLGRLLRRLSHREPKLLVLPGAGGDTPEGEEEETPLLDKRRSYSDSEVLRTKDFASLTPGELRVVQRLMRRRPWRIEPRRTRRRVRAASGPYLDLRFIYTLGATTDRLEAFVFATRLTRISRQLRHRDVDRALGEAAAAVVDWGGGTRIGDSFKRFNYDWGRRVLGHGTVVAILSDAWDRGDVDLLERETARLRRSCDRLLWLNPLLGSPGYQPLTRGIRRVLPYVDDFLPVHNLQSLEQLGRAMAKMGRGG